VYSQPGFMTEMKEDPKLQVLLNEYNAVTQEINMRIRLNQTIIGFGAAILGAALTLGVKEKITEILLPAPLVFFMAFFVGLFNTNGMLSLGGYKRYLEERINRTLGENILMRAEISRKLIEGHFITIVLYSSYVLVFGLTLLISLQEWLKYGIIVFMGSLVIGAFLSTTLIMSMIKLTKTSSKALEWARQEGNQTIAGSSGDDAGRSA